MTMRLIVEPIVRAALLEDLGRADDITTEAIVPEDAEVEAVIAARQPGVVAGQCCRVEAFDLDDNLPAPRRPETEMDAAAQLRLGADRQAPDGRRPGRDQMLRNEGLGRCYGLLLLVRDAYAGARVHAATSRSPTSPSFAPAID